MFLLCSKSPLSQGTRPQRAGLLGVALRVALGAAPEPNLRSVSALRAKHKRAVAAISRLLQPRRTPMTQSILPAPVSPLHHRLIDHMDVRTTWTCGPLAHAPVLTRYTAQLDLRYRPLRHVPGPTAQHGERPRPAPVPGRPTGGLRRCLCRQNDDLRANRRA